MSGKYVIQVSPKGLWTLRLETTPMCKTLIAKGRKRGRTEMTRKRRARVAAEKAMNKDIQKRKELLDHRGKVERIERPYEFKDMIPDTGRRETRG